MPEPARSCGRFLPRGRAPPLDVRHDPRRVTTFDASHLIDVLDHAPRYNRFLRDAAVESVAAPCAVLDFGAGTGRMLRDLRALGFVPTAVEPDATLRGRIAAEGVPSFASLDALGDRRFPLVISLNVLEHVPDDAAALRALFACTEPGGRLFLYVPALRALWTANDDRVGHLRRYGRAELAARCREAGFVVDDARFVDSLGAIASLAYRLFGSAEGELSPGQVRFYDRFVFPLSRLLDRALQRVVGKNLLLRAHRPS